MTELQLDDLKVKIDAGELVSFTRGSYEYMHQKGSPGWGKSDDEMFPIIGPTNEADFKVKTNAGTAIQDQHGLLREMDYVLIDTTATSAVFQKTYSANTKIKNSKFPKKSTEEWLTWPYSFTFQKQFKLLENELVIEFVIAGDEGMPFMTGYHPAFKLHSKKPVVVCGDKHITLEEIMAVGSRAYQVADCAEITLEDENSLTLKTEGFENFMLWTEVPNMLCIEPISFYPYAVEQKDLNKGFRKLSGKGSRFKIRLSI